MSVKMYRYPLKMFSNNSSVDTVTTTLLKQRSINITTFLISLIKKERKIMFAQALQVEKIGLNKKTGIRAS